MDKAKFLIVAIGAFTLDLMIVALLLLLTPLDVIAVTALSFISIAAIVYFFHEFWTFRDAASKFSLERLVSVAGAAVVSLGVRLLLLWALTQIVSPALWQTKLMLVTMAAAGSLIVNYLINSLIFRRGNLEETA